MSDYLRGLLTIPAAALVLAAAVAVAFGVIRVLVRTTPIHWALRGPQRRSADVRQVFRNVNVSGRHVDSFRRLLSLGPWTLYVARYRPGNVTER